MQNDLARTLEKLGALTPGVICNCRELFRPCRHLLTLGQYLFLTDHSGVGNLHEIPHVPEYQVERLDRLMIRMITAELSGRRLAPDEVIAIEQGRAVVPQPVPEAQPQPGQQRPRAASAPRAPARRQADSYVPIWTALAPPLRWAVLLALIAGACLLDAATTRRHAA